MDKVRCEHCPIVEYCSAYREAERHNPQYYTHHPHLVLRVEPIDCPLMALITQREETLI